MLRVLSVVTFICFLALSSSQQCDPNAVEWFPHQYSCSKFILCFHGNEIEKSCAPNLHFNARILKCDFRENARCEEFSCPPEDDVNNPIFYSDLDDCQRYFICFRGTPIHRSCSDGLWWDVLYDWCTKEDDVTCDDRTLNNPRPPTATEVPPTLPPILSDCEAIRHLFDQENGSYLKSFCIFYRSVPYKNYENAQNHCRDNNMELFVIDNSAVQSAFFEATTEAHDYPQGLLWTNGRRESSGEWFSFSPDRQQLYSGIDWLQTESIVGQYNGDCLSYTKMYGPYQAMGHDCEKVHAFTCQFYDETSRVNTEI